MNGERKKSARTNEWRGQSERAQRNNTYIKHSSRNGRRQMMRRALALRRTLKIGEIFHMSMIPDPRNCPKHPWKHSMGTPKRNVSSTNCTMNVPVDRNDKKWIMMISRDDSGTTLRRRPHIHTHTRARARATRSVVNFHSKTGRQIRNGNHDKRTFFQGRKKYRRKSTRHKKTGKSSVFQVQVCACVCVCALRTPQCDLGNSWGVRV